MPVPEIPARAKSNPNLREAYAQATPTVPLLHDEALRRYRRQSSGYLPATNSNPNARRASLYSSKVPARTLLEQQEELEALKAVRRQSSAKSLLNSTRSRPVSVRPYNAAELAHRRSLYQQQYDDSMGMNRTANVVKGAASNGASARPQRARPHSLKFEPRSNQTPLKSSLVTPTSLPGTPHTPNSAPLPAVPKVAYIVTSGHFLPTPTTPGTSQSPSDDNVPSTPKSLPEQMTPSKRRSLYQASNLSSRHQVREIHVPARQKSLKSTKSSQSGKAAVSSPSTPAKSALSIAPANPPAPRKPALRRPKSTAFEQLAHPTILITPHDDEAPPLPIALLPNREKRDAMPKSGTNSNDTNSSLLTPPSASAARWKERVMREKALLAAQTQKEEKDVVVTKDGLRIPTRGSSTRGGTAPARMGNTQIPWRGPLARAQSSPQLRPAQSVASIDGLLAGVASTEKPVPNDGSEKPRSSLSSAGGREKDPTELDFSIQGMTPESIRLLREKEKLVRWKAEREKVMFERKKREEAAKSKRRDVGRDAEKEMKGEGEGKGKQRGCLGGLFSLF